MRRDCAFTTPTGDGRTRHKLRGRVFKGRALTGDEAEWVVLDVVHEAIEVLLEINDDPTHLFGYRLWPTSPPRLSNKINERLAAFQDHLNELFGTPQALFIPTDGDQRWDFATRQFRRTPPRSPRKAVAMLDYVEDLYRDWNDGAPRSPWPQ